MSWTEGDDSIKDCEAQCNREYEESMKDPEMAAMIAMAGGAV